MLGSLTQAFGRLSVRPAMASTMSGPLSMASSSRASASSPFGVLQQIRHKSQLAPRRTKYKKSHKGRVPLHTGGSVKGTTLNEGMYGIRVLAPVRLSAKQLSAAETALKRKIKGIKGAQVMMRVFPDIPVCVKGNETRMGKGKGSFEFWACRATIGKVIFEIGGPVEIRPEVAREALRLAAAKLPVRTEFITRQTPPRLGLLVTHSVPEASVVNHEAVDVVSTRSNVPNQATVGPTVATTLAPSDIQAKDSDAATSTAIQA